MSPAEGAQRQRTAPMRPMTAYDALDAWIDAHFDEEVAFLAELVKVPTDTPPGDNAPHAERTAQLLKAFGFDAEKHPVPADEVTAYGLKSITNLIVRRRYGDGGEGGGGSGVCVALNAHGDVVPPGDGWTVPPYGGVVRDGRLYGRAAAVSKSDFATYAFAVRALEAAAGDSLKGSVELHFTYDEEFGGEKGPGWLLARGLTRPDYAIAASFSYAIITAHNGCLQFEVTVDGRMAHAAIPESGVDALQASVPDPAGALRLQPAVPAGEQQRARHHPSVSQRRHDQRRHEHQRRAGQGGVPDRPALHPGGGSGGRWRRRSAR